MSGWLGTVKGRECRCAVLCCAARCCAARCCLVLCSTMCLLLVWRSSQCWFVEVVCRYACLHKTFTNMLTRPVLHAWCLEIGFLGNSSLLIMSGQLTGSFVAFWLVLNDMPPWVDVQSCPGPSTHVLQLLVLPLHA
jgi:hypothetical protein